MSARAPRSIRPVPATLAVGLLILAAACDERFEFDIPAAAGLAGGGSAGLESGGAGGAGTAGAGAGSGGGGTGGDSPCGRHPACPSGLHCAGGECRACATSTDCTEPGRTRCDLTRYRCVECIDSSECAEGFRCDTLANRCLMACRNVSDCPSTAHGCNGSRGICYECDEDRECARSASGPFCAPDGSACVQCREDTDCDALLCDPLTGQCVECRDGLDCATGLCEPLEHVCLPEG
jgi:Cys-rich repeat protein